MVRAAGAAKGGQGVVEYVLLIAIIAALVMFFLGMLPGLFSRLEAPIEGKFKSVYRWGHPDATDTTLHPRKTDAGNFRIFIKNRR